MLSDAVGAVDNAADHVHVVADGGGAPVGSHATTTSAPQSPVRREKPLTAPGAPKRQFAKANYNHSPVKLKL